MLPTRSCPEPSRRSRPISRDGARGPGCPGGPVQGRGRPKVVDETLAWAGRCDILITNASYTPAGGFFEVPISRWTTGWNITVLSTVILMQGFLPGMLDRAHGRILHVGSGAAEDAAEIPLDWKGRPDGEGTPLLYGVTKSAVSSV